MSATTNVAVATPRHTAYETMPKDPQNLKVTAMIKEAESVSCGKSCLAISAVTAGLVAEKLIAEPIVIMAIGVGKVYGALSETPVGSVTKDYIVAPLNKGLAKACQVGYTSFSNLINLGSGDGDRYYAFGDD